LTKRSKSCGKMCKNHEMKMRKNHEMKMRKNYEMNYFCLHFCHRLHDLLYIR
jgi:hypothetical protein